MSKKKKYVDMVVNDYFDGALCDLIIHHISGRDSQRFYDSFRGMIHLAFHRDYLSVDGFLFFTDFIAWLENPLSIRDDRKASWCKFFYEDYVKIIEKRNGA